MYVYKYMCLCLYVCMYVYTHSDAEQRLHLLSIRNHSKTANSVLAERLDCFFRHETRAVYSVVS